jgi:ubiquinone/menaquinone biosynthesis C-methylase UbiE
MLTEARTANQHITNIEFVHNPANDLQVILDDSVDFLYSNIVLQHIPGKRQVVYIEEFCRVLRPKGIMAFQTPAKCNPSSLKGWVYWLTGNHVLNMLRRIKHGPSGVMEVHTLPQKTVLDILNQNGVSTIDVQRYDSAGSTFESYMYFVTKD